MREHFEVKATEDTGDVYQGRWPLFDRLLGNFFHHPKKTERCKLICKVLEFEMIYTYIHLCFTQ